MKNSTRIISLFLVVIMLLLAVACGESNNTETTTKNENTSTTAITNVTTDSENVSTTTTIENVATTTTTPVINPPVVEMVSLKDNKLLTEKVGSYLNLKYNKAYCDVICTVESGLGDDEEVSIKVVMKNGYIYDGLSEGNAISNGANSLTKTPKDGETVTITLSKETTVWVNCSMTYNYHANEGIVKGTGKDVYTITPSVTYYKNPNTLRELGYFTRDGYVLIGYNTEADGSGTFINIGSRPYACESSVLDLYCVWAKALDASDFEYSLTSTGAKITDYKGTSEDVVVPETIEGKPVITIAEGAFMGYSHINRVVLPSTIKTIGASAFEDSGIETLIMFDTVQKIQGNADSIVNGCSNFKTFILNAKDHVAYSTYLETNAKYDYLLFAKNQKKIVYVAGSSGQFGFVAEDMEKALDDYVVINYGSNANICSTIWFEMVLNFVNEDDIVLFAPEDGGYLFGNSRISDRLFRSIECNYDILRYMDQRNYTGLFSAYNSYISTKMNQSTYNASRTYDMFSLSVNNNGDIFTNIEAKNTPGGISFSSIRENDDLTKMNKVIDKIRDTGAKFILSFAPASKQAVDLRGHDEKSISSYEKKVITFIHNDGCISKCADHIYDNKYFHDSDWHMNLEGSTMRTKQLVEELKAWLSK